jgi:hypothetical protein
MQSCNRWLNNLARSFSWQHNIGLFLWETLKGIVYQDFPTTPENIQQRTTDECAAMNIQVTER